MKLFHRHRKLKIILICCLGCCLFISAAILFVFRPYSFGSPPQIPQGWGASRVKGYKGSAASPRPIRAQMVPQHPFLAKGNSSNMHVDGYASDVHPVGGPLGIKPSVTTYAHGRIGGECASVTFDSRTNIVAVCATFKEFSLLLMAPHNLSPLARFPLPARKSNSSLNLRRIMTDTSGGAYFFLDREDRAVLVDAKQRLRVIAQRWNGDHVSFEEVKAFELLPILKRHTSEEDVIPAVLPDWRGRYWFASLAGLIGIVVPETGETLVTRLPSGETVQNTFAVDEDGIYLVSDHALYGISAPGTNAPTIVWREEYATAKTRKPGMINLGSGTAPTLLGSNFVAIADNDEPRINVLVYQRKFEHRANRLVCKVPVFEVGRSATENSLIGIGNSLIVENNYGYDLFPTMMFGKTGAGGLARIDFDEDGGSAKVKWLNPIISQTTVPKLSLETGLVYVYAKDPTLGWGVDAYYLTAIDFETGDTVFQVLTGTGVSYDNNYAPITIGPDRSVYVGVLRGLVKISDGGTSK